MNRPTHQVTFSVDAIHRLNAHLTSQFNVQVTRAGTEDQDDGEKLVNVGLSASDAGKIHVLPAVFEGLKVVYSVGSMPKFRDLKRA